MNEESWKKCVKISKEGKCGEKCPELQKECCPVIEGAIKGGTVTANEVKENTKLAIDKILGRTK